MYEFLVIEYFYTYVNRIIYLKNFFKIWCFKNYKKKLSGDSTLHEGDDSEISRSTGYG